MKKQILSLLILGLLTGTIGNLAARGGGGGGHMGGGHMGGGHMGGGHMGGGHAGARSAGAHHGGTARSGGHHAAGAHHGGHGAHGGHGGHNHAHNKNWNHAHGYGWGWGAGGWGRGWAWGFWGWPFWWGLWWPYPFLYVGGVAAWSVANQTNDTIVVTSGDDEYTIDGGDTQLVPKSANGKMHIQAHYNNTGGTYTTHNTYVVAGDKEGKLVMDSDPGTQGEQE
ncbi:MAG: hypothetical protein ACHQVS_04075 [Candidatus Babeliales bacterium]